MSNSTHIHSFHDESCPHRNAVSVFFTTAMAIISVGAFIGNLLVFITVYKTPGLRTSTNYYYLNMAVSDFIASLTAWPLYVTDEIITSKGSLIEGPLATAGCKVGMYVRALSISVSMLSLVLIGVDRFIATVTPLKATLLSRRIRVTLMFLAWAIAMGYCVPMFYFSKVEDVGEETFCRFAWDDNLAIIIFYVVGFTMLIISPLFAIVILYSRIIRSLRQRPDPGDAGRNIAEQKRREQSQNIMRIFKTISIGYSVCIFLFSVYLILKMTFPEIFIKDKCKWFLGFSYFLFPSLSTVINPVILFSFSSNFRLALQALCPFCFESQQLCCKWRNAAVSPPNENVNLIHMRFPGTNKEDALSSKEEDSGDKAFVRPNTLLHVRLP